jgi:DNA-binding MarR family transcriptional regulator
MERTSNTISIFDLWLLMGKADHSIMLVRQAELREYRMLVPSFHILYTIQALGSKATLSEVARNVERKIHVVSRQAASMEKKGLIKRIKNTPKSKLLKLELTEKGLGIIKFARESKSIEKIFSCLSEEERQQMESNLKRLLIQTKEYAPPDSNIG